MCRTLRRCAALAAAYAVALQLMLSAFAALTPVAASGVEAAAICRGGEPVPLQPASHDACTACLAGHCGGPALVPGRVAVRVPQPVAMPPAEIAPRAITHVTQARQQHAARAPPLG